MDAGTRQVGLKQSADTVEDKTINYVNAKLEERMSKSIQESVGVAAFAYRTNRDKKLHFKLLSFGLASSLSNDITLTSYTINVVWRLP